MSTSIRISLQTFLFLKYIKFSFQCLCLLSTLYFLEFMHSFRNFHGLPGTDKPGKQGYDKTARQIEGIPISCNIRME